MKVAGVASIAVVLSAGAQLALGGVAWAGPHDELISKHSATHNVPESLVRRVIHIESKGNARIVSKGNYGLMQIRLGTARAMGYRGTAEGLLDADTNMTYAVKYLASAYRAAGCNEARAISYYQRGFYKKARAKCAVPRPTQIALDGARPGDTVRAQAVALRQPAPADVLRPRVVQVETITRPSHPPTPVRVAATPPESVANGQPAALPLPPAKQTVALAPAQDLPEPQTEKPATPEVSMLPMPRPRPASAPKALASLSQPDAPGGDTEAPAAAADQQIAKLDPEAVPLPVPRPETEAAPASDAKRAKRGPSRHSRSSRKQAEQPSLLELLKRLTTPDKPSRRSRSAQRAR